MQKLTDPMENFPDTPPRGDMTRKHRMDRLQKKLTEDGFYVRPVCLDDACHEWGYFIVSVDDPYMIAGHQGQDHG